MIRLPNCSQAIVPWSKIENYLLNFTHRDGKTKATFFSKFGYSISNAHEFQQTLVKMACQSTVIKIEERMPFGIRITTEGILLTPDNRNPKVKIGWFLDSEDLNRIPRLITVVPAK